MCGYSGFIYTNTSTYYLNPNLPKIFYAAAEKITHRGNEPLRQKFYDLVLLAHTRLAFQDVKNSTQPFISQDGKWVIIFNGEIYNFKALRDKMIHEKSYSFQTQGDTEVILAGFLNYGSKISSLLEGEFSFVIFKTDGSEVFASRDPFGVKPLFIALENINTSLFSNAKKQYKFETSSLNFSSEIKGLFCNKSWNRDGFLRQAVGLYEPIRTPFDHIISLPANSYLHAIKNGTTFSTKINLNSAPIRSSSHNLKFDSSQFQQHMEYSVRERTISDVELGVYLSGGIDSKVVTYELAQYYKTIKHNSSLKAFHVSFSDKKYDESEEVKKFSQSLNLNLHIIKITEQALQYSYPQAVYYSENIQPYTNGAAKWWLSLLASQHVKGVLTGDGADEVLCGYPSFQYANWWKFALRNKPGKNVFDKIHNSPLGSHWRDLIYFKKFSHHHKNPWLHGSSHEGSGDDFVESLHLWGIPHPLFGQIKIITCALLGEEEGMQWLLSQKESVCSWFTFGLDKHDKFMLNPENTLLLWQNYFCRTHLPVQVLNWVGDRMEMANTLEGRTPFLSSRIKNFVYNLPDFMLVSGFQEKRILRESYKNKLNQFSKTPKKQFSAPLHLLNKNEYLKDKLLEIFNQNSLLEKPLIEKLFTNTTHENNIFTQTHLNSTLQTLESFSLVQDYLIYGNKPNKDSAYEESILNQVPKVL